MMPTDEQCWEIIQRRDAAYDGVFFVGVMTTKIYCRPSCSARPLRKNVRFYPDTTRAREAGLRPCLRCHPDAIAPDAAVVQTIVELLQESPALSLQDLADRVHFSTYYVNRIFKKRLGVSVRAYAALLRSQRLTQRLTADTRITDAILDAGYGSLRAGYAAQPTGISLRARRTGGAHMQLMYGSTQTPLGVVALAQTSRGVCFVAMADDEASARAAVDAAFPRATIHHDQAATASALQTVAQLAANHPTSTEIPLDIQSTAFQQRVWNALRSIPVGETRSYSDIATAIGQPTAVRAVAQACANNPVAVIIPCHRVVHRDAGRDGYRWGVKRKQAMLANERTPLQEDRS